jgi:hypothetical protein
MVKCKQIEQKESQPEFNNGFVTSIALFLAHINQNYLVCKDKQGKVITDIRLYAATDHLLEMDFPRHLPIALLKRIKKWRTRCLKHRYDNFKSTQFSDSLFKEAEKILSKIDEQVLKTPKVIIRYS